MSIKTIGYANKIRRQIRLINDRFYVVFDIVYRSKYVYENKDSLYRQSLSVSI